MFRNATIVLATLTLLSGLALAQQSDPLRSISVSGTVETKTAPDRIVWRISLTDTDEVMREAKEKNDATIEAVIGLREQLGVGDQDMETGSVSIRREYERDERGGRGAFKHFVVNRSVTIRQHDLMRFDEFLDALVSSAEMDVHFNFESSRMHEIRAETRLRALQTAKDKAEAMAKVVGAKLGNVITINENSPGGRDHLANNSNMVQQFAFQSSPSIDFATDTFIPGAMSIQVTVHASFELL